MKCPTWAIGTFVLCQDAGIGFMTPTVSDQLNSQAE
jgi:hypothetical protein